MRQSIAFLRYEPNLVLEGRLNGVLRFEANLLLDPLGSYSSKLLEGLVEGSFVGGLVAQVESELGGGKDVPIFKHARVLEAQSAGAEPFMVGQALNENAFGFGLGLVLSCEAVAEFGEFSGIFIVEQVERLIVILAETVAGAVAARSLLARL
jgi:hypothetical protein